MKFSVAPALKKLIKGTLITIGSILLLLFAAPYIFPNTVAVKIKEWTNQSIRGKLEFSHARLSFFQHFPSLTLTLHQFSLKGSAPFQNDTLVAADELAFGINLSSLIFDKKVTIDELYLDGGNVNILVDEKGQANYNVYVSAPSKPEAAKSTDTSSAGLKIEKIVISDVKVLYEDKSIPLHIQAYGFNYKGTGDLSSSVFELTTKAKIDSLDFSLSDQYYLQKKNIRANLITKINTKSLSLVFQKNKLRINKLPITFTGELNFLQEGYDMDLAVSSKKADLYDIITAMPPQYLDWLEKTRIDGIGNIMMTLKGKYIASQNLSPDFKLHMDLKDGSVRYDKAPVPATNIAMKLDVNMPSLDVEKMEIAADSLFFNLDKDYCKGAFKTKGFSNPYVFADIDANLDLGTMQRAFGFSNVDTKGKLQLDLHANGNYKTDTAVTKSFRKTTIDTVVTSIPVFNIKASMNNGYVKYAALPEAVHDIHFALNAGCADSNYRHIKMELSDLNAVALKSYIKGNITLTGLPDVFVKAVVKADMNLQDIEKVYPIDSMKLAGTLKLDINSNGLYVAGHKFPVTTGDVQVQNGLLQTKYYPHPIENIAIHAKVNAPSDNMKDVAVDIDNTSFVFEGKPFFINASLKNFEDILYNVTAKGDLDIEKIYRVFSQKGLDVKGLIKADFILKGRQSDAMNGRYAKLDNKGTLQVKDLYITQEYFPKPFLISEGLFRFDRDKMWFKKFVAKYGQSDFTLDGYCSNVINYILSDNAVLKGDFKLSSGLINVNEFMAYAASPEKAVTDANNPFATQPAPAAVSGVVMIPANLDLHLQANAKAIKYNDLLLADFTGDATLSKAQLILKQAAFNMIGCQVAMDATYGSTSPMKAYFDYHIVAKDFDVKRAYNEVKVFHDLATAASKAEGIISLDYALKGKLDGNMMPVYPSITGGGILSVKNVKVQGLKLFSAVSSKTGKDDVKNPDISKVDFKTTIKNNIISLEQTKIKTAGFRIRIEGQTSFDGRINLKMRLGLPPLGIIGIPMKVTGTSENPNVAVGKNKDELEETEYKDED